MYLILSPDFQEYNHNNSPKVTLHYDQNLANIQYRSLVIGSNHTQTKFQAHRTVLIYSYGIQLAVAILLAVGPLVWLKANHPLYADVDVNMDWIEHALPDDCDVFCGLVEQPDETILIATIT